MTPEQLRRTEAITAALDALAWFKIPHTVDSCIGVYAEALGEQTRHLPYGATPTELADVLRASSDGQGGKGGHADPTPAAALRGEPDAADPDETLPQIDHALDMIRDGARAADRLVSDAIGAARWNPPPSALGRQGKVMDAVSFIEHLRPNLETAALTPDGALIDSLIRIDVAETAQWLHVKCSNIWAASRGEERPAEQSRRHTECTNCRSHGITGTTATAVELCAMCARFQSDNKCLPDQRIVRAWDRGSKSIPNGWVMECKAAAKVKPGRSRAS